MPFYGDRHACAHCRHRVVWLMMCVPVRRTHADTFGTHPQWPCDTAAGRGLFDLLSGDTISGQTRRKVGAFMKKHGFLSSNELLVADRRLGDLPQARLQRTRHACQRAAGLGAVHRHHQPCHLATERILWQAA